MLKKSGKCNIFSTLILQLVSKVDFWRENKDIFEFSRQIWPNIYAYSMIDFWRENSKQQMYLNFRAKNG